MRAGRIEQLDDPQTIYTRPSTAFVAQFIGLTNPLPGVAQGPVGDATAMVLGVPVPLLTGSPTSGPVTVLVRPEALTVVPRGTTEPTGPGDGTVAATSFLGALGRVQARLADGTLVLAQLPTDRISALAVGDEVTVGVQPVRALATGVET
jgi:putative spermidine/putrescine transport system ATP-binding protein